MKNKTKIPNYPLIDEHRKHYVRYPIQVMRGVKDLIGTNLPVGKFVAVDVLQKGYQHLLCPVIFDTEEECQKACDIHNKYHGWSKDDVNEIVGISMDLVKIKTVY